MKPSDAEGHCGIRAKARRRRSHAKAWELCLWQIAPTVSQALNLAPRTVQGWENPYEKGRSPTERASEAMWASLDLGTVPEDARAPLFALAREHGYLCVAIDRAAEPPAEEHVLRSASEAIAAILRYLLAVTGSSEEQLDTRRIARLFQETLQPAAKPEVN